MERFGPLWILLFLTVCGSAVSYTNDVEEVDDSVEEFRTNKKNTVDRQSDKSKRPSISEDAIFLPHEKFCQYFYVFDGRESSVFSCAKGHYFDERKLQCLKSKNVDCGKRKKTINSSEERHIGHIHYKCPKWSGYYAHEHYCHLYYNCQTKKPQLYMCPPGMLFDSSSNKCNYRSRAHCDKRIDPYEESSKEEEITTSDETYSCIDFSGVYPHPKHCNKFVRCWFNIGDIYTCPHNKLFDTDLMTCRPKDSVHCQGREDPYEYDKRDRDNLIDPEPYFECEGNKGRFPHEEDCSMFYECLLGESSLYQCPANKMFDQKTKTCLDENKVICEHDLTKDEDEAFICPSREGTFKDSENCGYFYKCRNGRAQHFRCEEGELFDTDWKSCNDEEEVTCGDRLLPGDFR